MSDPVELVTVDAGNFEELGFFCYKSKPKSDGYRRKLEWLRRRFAEGMRLQIIYESGRSVGFVEYLPGEHCWRAVEAPGYIVIHCLWVVGRSKQRGYGERLLSACCDDAQRMGKRGVAMVSSRGNWLADERLFLKQGFESVDTALPAFNLLVKRSGDGAFPSFPNDWDERLQRYGSGTTIVYADQCPYTPDAVQGAVDAFAARGVTARTVALTDSAMVQAQAPSAFGVFGIVHDGELFSYHYLGPKELRQLDARLYRKG